MPQPAALTDREVASKVRQLVKANRIAWTTHAEERLACRGIDKSEVKECLLRGTFTESPVIPNRSGPVEYKFTMQATVDSELLSVAASLLPAMKVVVITVF
jgi:hypothetical protein